MVVEGQAHAAPQGLERLSHRRRIHQRLEREQHFFNSDDEARGAFKLAHQQGLDGTGTSIQAWMGLTREQYDAWMRNGTLP